MKKSVFPSVAQGALEYLLLIGGAVVIASVVAVLILGLSSTSSSSSSANYRQMNERLLVSGGGGNIVANPSFENGMQGWSDEWEGAAAFHAPYADAKTGAYSYRLTNSPNYCNNYIYQQAPVKANTRYKLSGWIKTIGETGLAEVFMTMGSVCYPAYEWQAMVASQPGLTGTNGWTRVEMKYDSGTCTNLRYGFALFSCSSSGDSYFDDMILVEDK